MLILIRLATAFGIFVVLFCVLLFGGIVLGAGIAGARVATTPGLTPEEVHTEARKAGEDFGRRYGVWIFMGSFVASGAVSLALTFTGALPWCRSPEPARRI
jgi:hypothetical protein